MRTVEVGAERSGQEWISPVSIPHDMNRTYQFILGRNAGGRFRRFAPALGIGRDVAPEAPPHSSLDRRSFPAERCPLMNTALG